jgi:hypothetical protein
VRYRTELFGARADDGGLPIVRMELPMNISLSLAPLVSLLAGILILIVPRLLNFIVAAYLIVVGILGLVGDVHFR